MNHMSKLLGLGVAALVLGSIVPRVAAETSWTSCGNYSDALNSVAAGLAASRVCSGSIWKKETAMSHTLSMGSLLKLYPLEILTHTECRIFFAQRLKENVRQLQEEPEECDRMVEMLTIDEALRNRFDQLGLINTN